MPTTTIISTNQVNKQAGSYTFDAPSAIAPDVKYATFELVLNDADKLSVGISLVMSFWFSVDGMAWPSLPANQTTWTSYGPAGLTVVDPDGTVRVNPNPRVQLGMIGHAGQFLRGRLDLSQALKVGVLVTETT